MSYLWYIFFTIYIPYSVLFLVIAYRALFIIIPTYRNLPKRIKEKYHMYYRKDADTLNRYSLILGGLTTGFIRFGWFIIIWIFINFLWASPTATDPSSCPNSASSALVKVNITMFVPSYARLVSS